MSYPMERAVCPACCRDVAILPPREGDDTHPTDFGWRYRSHARYPGGPRCRHSGQYVPDHRLPDYLSA